MRLLVTPSAQGDEIFLCIITEQTARLHVMHLEITQRSTELTAPAISPQHLHVQGLVRTSIKPQPRSFGADGVHTVIRALSKNFCLLGCGRASKSRSKEIISASEFPVSRFAPARKSAQIISSMYPRDLSLPSIRVAVSNHCGSLSRVV